MNARKKLMDLKIRLVHLKIETEKMKQKEILKMVAEIQKENKIK